MGEKFDPDAAQERLDELGDDIERTREATDERDPLGDGERSFADTDDPPQENDQGVAPPHEGRSARGVTGPLRLAPAALVAWTILTWVTRVPLAWGDPALDATAKVLATLPVAVFVALSLATLVAWRRAVPGSTTPRRLAAALAIWSIAYWAVRLPLILVHDHPAAFLVVHAVLATVAVALSAAALVALSRWSRPTAPADAPVTEAALRG